jgi:hypothetical protein
MRSAIKYLLPMGLLVSLIGIIGCGEGEPPISQKTKEQGDRLSQIRERTGYSWEKATDEDKKFLIDTCGGNEGCARQLLFRPGPGQGGPRGRPGGGPPPPSGG